MRLSMKSRLSWLVVILGIALVSMIAFGYGYFRWARWNSLQASIAQGRVLAGPSASETEALVRLLESPDAPLGERNRALWALGEMGDDSVLPILREMDRYEECEHATRICVRELRKAIWKLERSKCCTP